MSKSLFIDLQAVKAAITMEQVLQHYGLLDRFKRGTDSLSGPCPIHRGGLMSEFRIIVSKNVWYCSGDCKHGGNVLNIIAILENVSLQAAAIKAIEWFNLDSDAMSQGSELSLASARV
jgi:DNA primase